MAVAPGDFILLRLPENPTTGFRWYWQAASREFVALESDSFEPLGGEQIGAGGTRVLSYRALRPGTESLRLVLWRDWEGESSITRRFQVVLEIRGAGSQPVQQP